jgi:hypothetical protein
VKSWLRRLDGDQTRREIEDELRLHLDLLTEEHRRLRMSEADAHDAALRRFGNLEQVTNECVAITKRRHPAIVALKSLVILVFLLGVFVRVFSPEYHVTRVGDILMVVGILGRLLLYLRTVSRDAFLSANEPLTTLVLNDKSGPRALDNERRTPLERVISDR